jgi:hypothetical protein
LVDTGETPVSFFVCLCEVAVFFVSYFSGLSSVWSIYWSLCLSISALFLLLLLAASFHCILFGFSLLGGDLYCFLSSMQGAHRGCTYLPANIRYMMVQKFLFIVLDWQRFFKLICTVRESSW